ncbi:MAG: chromate transporter [Oscillospiraceae bacterium]|nr:chromate transporter [Oscillospiraceae bacterium]
MTLIEIVLEFLKTGLFAVGGGLAVLPFLAEFADKHGWYTLEQLREFIAVSESIPGPLGVNVVIFAGYAAFGVLGGIVAALSLVTPSVIIVNAVSRALNKYRESTIVADLFAFLRPMSVGLIAGAVFPLITAAILLETGGFNITASVVFVVMTIFVFALNFAHLRLTARFTARGRGNPALLALLRYLSHPLMFVAAGAVLGIVFGGF